MNTYRVFYYGKHIATLSAPDRVSAVRQLGVRYGGMAGITLESTNGESK